MNSQVFNVLSIDKETPNILLPQENLIQASISSQPNGQLNISGSPALQQGLVAKPNFVNSQLSVQPQTIIQYLTSNSLQQLDGEINSGQKPDLISTQSIPNLNLDHVVQSSTPLIQTSGYVSNTNFPQSQLTTQQEKTIQLPIASIMQNNRASQNNQVSLQNTLINHQQSAQKFYFVTMPNNQNVGQSNTQQQIVLNTNQVAGKAYQIPQSSGNPVVIRGNAPNSQLHRNMHVQNQQLRYALPMSEQGLQAEAGLKLNRTQGTYLRTSRQGVSKVQSGYSSSQGLQYVQSQVNHPDFVNSVSDSLAKTKPRKKDNMQSLVNQGYVPHKPSGRVPCYTNTTRLKSMHTPRPAQPPGGNSAMTHAAGASHAVGSNQGQASQSTSHNQLDLANLTKDAEYNLTYSDGRIIRAVFDGKHFVILKDKDDEKEDQSRPAKKHKGDNGANNATRPPHQMAPGEGNQQHMVVNIPKRPAKPFIKGKYAMCTNCGNASRNYLNCDSCHRELPDDVRYHINKNEMDPNDQRSTAIILQHGVNKVQFYGSQAGVKSVLASGMRRGLRGNLPKKQPEMVTISSDEEEFQENMSSINESNGELNTTQNSSFEAWPSAAQIVNTVLGRQDGQKSSAVPREILETRAIRIGSLKAQAFEPVSFSGSAIHISIETANDSLQMTIQAMEISCIQACFNIQMPVIFLQTTPGCSKRIRDRLGMGNKDQQIYYEPFSTVEAQKRIVLLLKSMTLETRENLLAIFQSIKESRPNAKSDFFVEISYETANNILIGCAVQPQAVIKTMSLTVGSPMLQLVALTPEDMEDDSMDGDRSRSPSPLMTAFAGPIVKLFTYPPPPATGGIPVSNEDLFCLNDGEFLNDVIIDFYLKYMYLELLSEEDRKRTHIFSSFFYRRLTQKPKRGGYHDEDTNASPAERRHSRVKSWTRKLDVFEKDFIIVPINESAHWYLAIICFPGRTEACTATRQRPKLPEKVLKSEPITGIKEEKELPEEAQNTQVQETTSTVENNSSQEESSGQTGSSPAKQINMEDKNEAAANGKTEGLSDDPPLDETNDTQESEELSSTMDTEDSNATLDQTSAEDPMSTTQESTKVDEGSFVKTEVTGDEQVDDECTMEYFQVYEAPCILMFDSLAGPGRFGVIKVIREYLQVEWDIKKAETFGDRIFNKDTIKGNNPKVPQQTNYSDCGIYVLEYIEKFFQKPLTTYECPIKNLADWFTEEEANVKRPFLRDLIFRLKDQLNPNLDYDLKKDIIT